MIRTDHIYHRKSWTQESISTNNRNYSLEMHLCLAGSGFLVVPPSARSEGRTAFQCSHHQPVQLLPRPAARRKGPLSLRHVPRSSEIPPLLGGNRPHGGPEAGAYPQRLDHNGKLCRPRLRAAPGATGEGSGDRSRFKPAGGSFRLKEGFDSNAF